MEQLKNDYQAPSSFVVAPVLLGYGGEFAILNSGMKQLESLNAYDYKRNLRDSEANRQKYIVVDPPSISPHLSARALPSSSLLVGQLVRLQKNDRVPADMVLLWTSDPSGTCFVRTDQLDGETDWKMCLSVGETQGLREEGVAKLGSGEAEIYADAPTKDIHTFIGTLTLHPENVLSANTVLASSATIIGFFIYTGPETCAVMNTSTAGTKVGLLEVEVNGLAKILCTTTYLLSLILITLNGFRDGIFTTHTVVSVFRFLISFSSINPISLRINLDLAKSLYSHQIMTDSTIPGTIVRTSTLPEELGRVEYLLSYKTGTLTRNEMQMRRLHMGTMSYSQDFMDEVAGQLALAFASANNGNGGAGRGRRDMSSRVRDVVESLALLTNDDGSVTYQVFSPDEFAIVTWTQTIGLTLVYRDRTKFVLRAEDPARTLLTFTILAIFPFTSTSKRMGIILLDHSTSDILFPSKALIQRWARRCRRRLRLSMQLFRLVLEELEEAMTMPQLTEQCPLLELTGVDDRLQDEVRLTLELMRNAEVKVWMLTGDKVKTARCIAISTKMVSRGQYIHESLQFCLSLYKNGFMEIATKLSAVVACRCSPTQKVKLCGKRVCCIGDGANDVSMIQAPDVGIGLVGKEAVFSAIFYFAPIALYQGSLMVRYATVYTMMPVFSLVLDRDVSRETALIYPELYKELVKGRWVMISVYQSAAIMIMSVPDKAGILDLAESERVLCVMMPLTGYILQRL
ncbi:hypothetical protein F5877DRAFT_92481 [Lentinula edodes]|nr:hypothetical protein F5877DRAFT_92481 [Lentinula edodes]